MSDITDKISFFSLHHHHYSQSRSPSPITSAPSFYLQQHHHQFPYPQSPEQPRDPQFSPYLTKRLAPATDSALNDSLDWDEFNDSAAMQSKEELDSGSRRPIFEPDPFKPNPAIHLDTAPMDDTVLEIEEELDSGSRHL
ncbi:hypothetical protein ACFX13_009419 [Malus domestica]|uniref:Uncharacterized protein n=1 Tax=Malus domestica TaxID=3750 RepID=A0A498ICA5_MALDO|nr:hypothetical protein DVH24_004774 [Malus domestica]